MLKRYTRTGIEVLIAVFTIVPVIILGCFYQALPEQIPEYLTLTGEVETYSDKGFLAVFRLPLMAVVLQVICLLMKYGTLQAKHDGSFEAGEQALLYREQARGLYGVLWDWFRLLVAVKFAASSLDTIFLAFPHLQQLSMAARVISLATAVLGIAGLVFYGRRLLGVNRRLKELGVKTRRQRRDEQAYVRWNIFYYNPDDAALFHDKYLLNFANRWSYVLLAALISLPVLMLYPMLSS